MAAQKPTLGYWGDVRGFAASIRYQLAYSGVEYESKDYFFENKADWESDKQNLGLPFANIPYWIDGEFKLTETMAIHTYLAEKYMPELLGKDVQQRALNAMTERAVRDALVKIRVA